MADAALSTTTPTARRVPPVQVEAPPPRRSLPASVILAGAAPSITIHRPTAREMRAAYRRIGAPIPTNLRGLFWRAWA